MGLAHPGKLRQIVDFHHIAPEVGEDLAFQLIKQAGCNPPPRLRRGIHPPLEFSFQQMSDEVVVVCAQILHDHPALHLHTVGLGENVIAQKQLIHGGWGFHKIGRRPQVQKIVVLHRQGEMAGVTQFVDQCESGTHVVGPGHENIRVHSVDGRAKCPCRFADIIRQIHPTVVQTPFDNLHIL